MSSKLTSIRIDSSSPPLDSGRASPSLESHFSHLAVSAVALPSIRESSDSVVLSVSPLAALDLAGGSRAQTFSIERYFESENDTESFSDERKERLPTPSMDVPPRQAATPPALSAEVPRAAAPDSVVFSAPGPASLVKRVFRTAAARFGHVIDARSSRSDRRAGLRLLQQIRESRPERWHDVEVLYRDLSRRAPSSATLRLAYDAVREAFDLQRSDLSWAEEVHPKSLSSLRERKRDLRNRPQEQIQKAVNQVYKKLSQVALNLEQSKEEVVDEILRAEEREMPHNLERLRGEFDSYQQVIGNVADELMAAEIEDLVNMVNEIEKKKKERLKRA